MNLKFLDLCWVIYHPIQVIVGHPGLVASHSDPLEVLHFKGTQPASFAIWCDSKLRLQVEGLAVARCSK